MKLSAPTSISQVALVGLKIDGRIMAQTAGWLLYNIGNSVKQSGGWFTSSATLHVQQQQALYAWYGMKSLHNIHLVGDAISHGSSESFTHTTPTDSTPSFWEKRTSPRTQGNYRVKPSPEICSFPQMLTYSSSSSEGEWPSFQHNTGHSAPRPPCTLEQWPWDEQTAVTTQHIWIDLGRDKLQTIWIQVG